jgi:hypothetical protein
MEKVLRAIGLLIAVIHGIPAYKYFMEGTILNSYPWMEELFKREFVDACIQSQW